MDVVASSITFVSTIISAYNAISRLNQLPQEFQEVQRRLTLVQNTLCRVRDRLEEELIDDSTKLIITESISRCDDFGRKLKDIFDDIEAYDAREGSALMRYKKTLVSKGKQIGKAHRVELLMTGMLACVKDLAENHIFQLATQNQVAQLSVAIDALSNTMSSVTDADFDRASYSASQNIASGGTGNQGIHNGDGAFNNSGGNTIHSNGGPTLLHASGTFNFGMNVGHHETPAEKERREKEDERRTKVMRSLAPLSYLEAKNRNKKRLDGTCVWFTEHEKFQQWSSTTESSFLLVSADPGCGKSVLSRHLVDSILPRPDTGRILCYFFFKEDIELQASAINALCCVLHQIFTARLDLLTSDILNTFEHNNNTVKSVDELWKVLLRVTSDERCQEVVCVFDALDECPERERDILSCAVRSHFEKPSSHSRLKVLITSRPYEHVTAVILPRTLYMTTHQEGEVAVIHLRGETQDEVDKIAAEIDIVIQDEVDILGARKKWPKEDVECVKSQLRKVPNRTYLWAHLTIDWLKQEKGLRRRDFKSLSKRLPRTVDQAYDRILCRAGSRRPEILKLLQVVVAATRALTLTEMDLALSIRSEDKELEDVEVMGDGFESYVRDLCGLFVTVVDSKVYFLHQTAKEFLVGDILWDDSPNSWKHTLSIANAHETMFQICSWVILALEKCPREPDQTKTQLKQVYCKKCALFDYSVDHFDTHYKSSAKDQFSTLTALLNMDSERHYEDPYREPLCFRMRPWLMISRMNEGTSTPLLISLHYGWSSFTRKLLESESGRHVKELRVPSDSSVRNPLLIVAARSGDAELASELLSRVNGTRRAELVNERDHEENTPLMIAAKNFDLQFVQFLTDAGADINATHRNGSTALFYACVAQNREICEHLLKRGALLFDKTRGHNNIYPLLDKSDFLISLLGEERMAQEFSQLYREVLQRSKGESPLLRFCDINEASCDGFTVLTDLMNNFNKYDNESNDKRFQDLIKRGAKILSADGNGHTPLWYCTQPNHHLVIRAVLNEAPPEHFKRADNFLQLLTTKTKSQLSSDDRTQIRRVVDALFAYACKYDNVILASDIYAADIRQFHAGDSSYKHLLLAIAIKCEDIVEVLINCHHGGYSVSELESILIMALFTNQETALGTFLPMLKSADTQAFNSFLSSVAFVCAYVDNPIGSVFLDIDIYRWFAILGGIHIILKEVQDSKPSIETTVALLRRHGADINARDKDGKTALFHADSDNIVRELLKQGADFNARDKYSRTALFYTKYTHVVEQLLQKGADIEAKDDEGATPLLFYIAQSQLTFAEYLIRRGANISQMNSRGETALRLAFQHEVTARKFVKYVEGYGYIETSIYASVVAILKEKGALLEDGLLFSDHSAHMRSLIENWPSTVQRQSGFSSHEH